MHHRKNLIKIGGLVPALPRHDLVSRVDQQLGAELGIACDKNPPLGMASH
jgi:hypothetical protein